MVRRILIVDDEADHAASLRDLFEVLLSEAPVVDTVTNSAAARTMLDHHAYDLVISDEGMPGDRGTELLRWFHQRAPRVPKILMSAYPEDAIGQAAIMAAGVRLFLLKPFDQEEMLAQVERILSEP